MCHNHINSVSTKPYLENISTIMSYKLTKYENLDHVTFRAQCNHYNALFLNIYYSYSFHDGRLWALYQIFFSNARFTTLMTQHVNLQNTYGFKQEPTLLIIKFVMPTKYGYIYCQQLFCLFKIVLFIWQN